jgi:hypothetical protein
MKRILKYVFIFLLILLAACIKEDHYKDIEEIQGIGLPIEINNRTKVLYAYEPYFESFDEITGLLKLHNISETPALNDSDILVIGLDTSGVIRKVVEIIDLESNPIEIITEIASMEDVFIDAEFKLSTELVKPASSFKSANIFSNQNTEALTDDDGFIHPVKIIIHKKNGEKIIKSALLDGKDINDDIPEGDFIFGENLRTKVNFDGEIYSNNNVSFSIDTGYVEFAPVFKFEFKFQPPEIDISKLKIEKGELHKLVFYSDKTKFDFKTVFKLEAEGEYKTKEHDPKILLPDILKVSFVFAIGPVPVYMDINCDLRSDFDVNIAGKIEASVGFQSTHYITLGAEYYKSTGWKKINKYTPINTVIPLRYNGPVQFDSRFEIYPRFEVIFYKVIGPYLEVVPFLSSEFNVFTQNGVTPWNANVDIGLDLRAGVDIKFLNIEPHFTFEPASWNLYAAPHKISMASGSGQTQIVNKKMAYPFTVKVEDDKGNPLRFVPVYFSSTNGGKFDDKIVETKEDGIASAKFTSGSKTGEGEVQAIIMNGKREQIDETVVFKYSVMEGKPPQFLMPETISVSQTFATIKCRMTDSGDANVAEQGLIYGENPNFESDTTELKSDNPVSTEAYEIKITGLTRGARYYVRAYAKDEDEKKFPGPILPFETGSEKPTVKFISVNNEKERSAYAKGKIEDDGGSEIIERGFVYSQIIEKPVKENDGKNARLDPQNDGKEGQFEFEILGLFPDTEYYIRAYAINKNGISYSEDSKKFKTKIEDTSTIPKVNTLPSEYKSDISENLRGEIESTGDADITKRGFVWKEKDDSATDTLWIYDLNAPFEKVLSGLTKGEKYEYWAFAFNKNGGSNSAISREFTAGDTSPIEPKIRTDSADDITDTSATLKGFIESNGGADIIEYGFYLSRTNGFNDGDKNPNPLFTGDKVGEYSFTKEDLESGTTYYYKAYARNSVGSDYGEQQEFKMGDGGGGGDDPIELEVKTFSIKKEDIGTNDAVCWGEITSGGGADIEEYGIELKVPNVKKEATLNDGAKFGSYFNNLNPGEYQFRAYAKNKGNDYLGYGVWKTFKIEPPTKEITCLIVDKWTGHIKKVSLRYNRPNNFSDDYTIKAGEVSGGLGVYRGWAIFDISNIESNAKIEKVEIEIRCDETADGESSTLYVTRIRRDPRLASSSGDWKDIYNEMDDEIYGTQNLNDDTSDTYIIELDAVQDFQTAVDIHKSVFFIGFREASEDKKRIMIDGYMREPPKLKITYTLQ